MTKPVELVLAWFPVVNRSIANQQVFDKFCADTSLRAMKSENNSREPFHWNEGSYPAFESVSPTSG